jgi:hypothetical protein
MKIVGISNFCKDNVSDIIIAENVNEYYGKLIIKFLEEITKEHDEYYPKLVDDNYKLYKWRP